METLESLASTTQQQKTHAPIVQKLKQLLKENNDILIGLNASLIIACSQAEKQLNPDLYKAINHVFKGNGWPSTAEAYYDYLDLYVRLIPNESNDPMYPNAWKSNGESNGYNQKVYDLLCQFYWLVNQKIDASNKTMQSFTLFAEWLDEFAKAWGEFLDTPESLTKETLHSFKYDSMYNFDLYSENEGQWHTFNEFFYREFNQADPLTGISPLRPISAPHDNTNIVSPADCTFKQNYPINSNGDVIEFIGGSPTSVTFKGTHTIGNINDLLDGSEYADEFRNGTFVHYFLSPFDYHRFHTPVSGKILEIKPVQGKVYLDVDLLPDGQWDAPDSATDGYEFNQARGMVIMDAGPVVGKIAILPIGMAQVSGVDMYTELQGKQVIKGQEFGKFKFGGSDIILLFQKAPDLYLFKKDPSHNPIHFQYGQTVAYWNENKQ